MESAAGSAARLRPSRLGLRRSLSAGSHAYALLLPVILASLAFQLAAPDAAWARGLTIGFQSAALLGALHLSGVHAWLWRFAGIVVAIALLGVTGLLLGAGELDHAAGRAVGLMLAGLAPLAIAYGVVRETMEVGHVTIRVMFGVLCIYLLLGILFAFAFGVAAALADGQFFAGGDAETQANFLYFSFVTQTTTGYGDLVPATGIGRSLAVTEALIGQIYLVTVVALIVANLGRARRGGPLGPR